MLTFLRSLFTPEVILHALVMEARAKRYRTPGGVIRVSLGDRRLDRVGVLDKSRIEMLLNNFLQISGLTDEYRPTICVETSVCENGGERVLLLVEITLKPIPAIV